MSQRTYHIVAAIGLVPAALLTAWLGPILAGFLRRLDPSLAGILGVLGWALAALVGVVALAVVVWPLRVRAGYPSLSDEARQLKEHGMQSFVEQAKAENAKAHHPNPATRRQHHLGIALVGALLSAGAILITWGAWTDGHIVVVVALAAVVLPAMTLYHLVRAIVPGRNRDE